MALEELFKNVTKRFNDDAPEEHEPVFKCPRCQQTTPESNTVRCFISKPA